MTIIGKVQDSKREFEFEWEIDDFLSYSEAGKSYESPSFSFAGDSWNFYIYPNGFSEVYAGNISVYLRRKPYGPLISLARSLGLKTCYGKICKERQFICDFEKMNDCCGTPVLFRRSELLEKKSELLPSGTLTIFCTLVYCNSTDNEVAPSDGKINEDEASKKDDIDNENEMKNDDVINKKKCVFSEDKGINKLLENFRQIFLDKRMSDVVLKLDGREFNVHKMVLIAQSPVFASMFQHDLAEKNDNVVNIPDCTPESFEVFLHYLYCGRPENMSTSNVYNVYYAADKYQVDELKEKCIEFMINNISIETFCDVIALSLRHGESELKKTATDFFCQNIKKIIKTVEWQKYLDENSTQANELLIKALNA